MKTTVTNDNTINFPDLKCTVSILTTEVGGENILVTLEEGRFRGTVLKLYDFQVDEDILNYRLLVVVDPNENKKISYKYAETISRAVVLKILKHGTKLQNN